MAFSFSVYGFSYLYEELMNPKYRWKYPHSKCMIHHLISKLTFPWKGKLLRSKFPTDRPMCWMLVTHTQVARERTRLILRTWYTGYQLPVKIERIKGTLKGLKKVHVKFSHILKWWIDNIVMMLLPTWHYTEVFFGTASLNPQNDTMYVRNIHWTLN